VPIRYVFVNRYASTGKLSPTEMLTTYSMVIERTETKKPRDHGIDESTLVILDINAKRHYHDHER